MALLFIQPFSYYRFACALLIDNTSPARLCGGMIKSKNLTPAQRVQAVRPSLIRAVHQAAAPGAINLGMGELQFAAPLYLRRLASRICRTQAITYTPNAGLPEAREAVSQYYGGVISAQNVCLTCGAAEALWLTVQAWVQAGDTVLIPRPAYPAYAAAACSAGAEVAYIDTTAETNFYPTSAQLEPWAHKAKMLVLCHPANPTGMACPPTLMKEIAAFCHKNNIILLVDEIYRELFLDAPLPSFVRMPGLVVVVSGLSKSHLLTGWRLGWLASTCPELVEPVVRLHQYNTSCAPYVAQKLAAVAWQEDGIAHLNRLRANLRSNYRYTLGFLKRHGLTPYHAQAAPYLFFSYPGDDLQYCLTQAAAGVILTPGQAFDMSGHIRLNYAQPRTLLRAGLQRWEKNL